MLGGGRKIVNGVWLWSTGNSGSAILWTILAPISNSTATFVVNIQQQLLLYGALDWKSVLLDHTAL